MTFVAVITGASAGIGQGITEYFVEKGIHLALLARRKEKLISIAENLENKYDIVARPYKCDVTRRDEIEAVFASIGTDFDYISILINNAGISSRASLEIPDPTPLQRDFDVNVVGSYMCSVLASQLMV